MRTDGVHHGISSYIDHDRPWAAQRQWLISDRSATIWSNVLAIFLSFATARCFPILKRILYIVWPPQTAATGGNSIALYQTGTQATGSTPAPASGAQNLGSTANVATQNTSVAAPAPTHAVSRRRRLAGNFNLDLDDQHYTGGAGVHMAVNAAQLVRPGRGLPTGQQPTFQLQVYLGDMYHNLRHNFREIAIGMSVGIGLIALQIAFLAVSIFSGLVISDSVALSKSPHCTLVVPNWDNASTTIRDKWNKRNQDFEVESLEYVKRCYSANARSEECSYFYYQSIGFSVEHNSTCPFGGDICLYGPTSAFTMTTGMIAPRNIGINTRKNYRVERTTTCSPLRMDEERFLQRYIKDEKHYFRYFYGGFDANSTSTWDLPIEITSKPMYRVFGVSKGLFVDDADWHPIPELLHPNDTITIMLIGNTGISYPTPSHDPIFHAEAQLSDGKFYNEHAYSAVLACRDQTIFYHPNGTLCGNIVELTHHMPEDWESVNVINMLALSIQWSDIGNAMKLITGEVLEAQSYMIGIGSLILAPEQWKVEVQRLFAVSLARIQITARNIARGIAGEELPGTDMMAKRPGFNDMCNIYKFRSDGWKNMSVAGFLGSFVAGLILIGMSFKQKNSEELWFEEYLAASWKVCKAVASAIERAVTAGVDRLRSSKMMPQRWRVPRPGAGRP